MDSPSPFLFLCLLSFLLAHLAFSTCHARLAVGGVSIELLHRDSLSNTSMAPSARVRAAFRRSAVRMEHLASLSQQKSLMDDSDTGKVSISSRLFPAATNEYLMSLSLGTPPVSILVSPDTGSDLIWTMCAPCSNCTRRAFRPRRSPTYRRLRCSSAPCKWMMGMGMASCGGLRRRACEYTSTYGDGSSTSGLLSRETFTFFGTRAGGHGRGRRRQGVSIPKVVFGCSRRMGGLLDTGLVGLGRGPLSLISQLGSRIGGRFSYCLVPITQRVSSGRLTLGATVAGPGVVTTPIVPPGFMGSPSLDYMSLLDVTVGGTTIRAGFPIAADSGTALTFLPPRLVSELELAIGARVRLPRVRDPQGQFNLCYRTRSQGDVAQLPDVVFGFGGGASLGLKPENTFVPADEEGVVCLGIVEGIMTVLGYFAQQNLHVGFDRVKNTVSFIPADCTNL